MSQTMLIVDDSRVSRMMIKAFASEVYPDWSYVEAGSGEEALSNIQEHKIDVATVDMNMPGMDGVELAKQLRGLFPDARITLLTANVQDTVRRRVEAINVHFVAKPITQGKVQGFLTGSLA